MQQTTTLATDTCMTLAISPARVMKGVGILPSASDSIVKLGRRPLIVGGDRSLALVRSQLESLLTHQPAEPAVAAASYHPDCSESTLENLHNAASQHQADLIIGVGGGKALDAAKLLAHQRQLPVVTIPTSGATCAAWTALSNIYTTGGAFLYDVSLHRCPELLVLDYNLVQTAPPRTLIAGIGDALAKWYEASLSSGDSQQSITIAAVQQARILRDILLQKSPAALQNPGSEVWQEVVDATVLLPGVVGGLGGAQCRTVAAHPIHNGLTHLQGSHHSLHGEKVAYGILVQLRLEETLQGNQLASAARAQLLPFYQEIGLPQTLEDLGLGNITLTELRRSAEIACQPDSDIHNLPFPISGDQLVAAMVSTTVPTAADTHTVTLGQHQPTNR